MGIGPLCLYRGRVEPSWVDANGHMNDGYYPVAFGIATWAVQDHLGLDPAYRSSTGGTLYTVEAHVTYARELKAGQSIRIESQLLGADAKRIRVFHRMIADDDGFTAATMDIMMLHYDQNASRTSPMPPELSASIIEIARSHAALGWPEEAGRSVKNVPGFARDEGRRHP